MVLRADGPVGAMCGKCKLQVFPIFRRGVACYARNSVRDACRRRGVVTGFPVPRRGVACYARTSAQRAARD